MESNEYYGNDVNNWSHVTGYFFNAILQHFRGIYTIPNH